MLQVFVTQGTQLEVFCSLSQIFFISDNCSLQVNSIKQLLSPPSPLHLPPHVSHKTLWTCMGVVFESVICFCALFRLREGEGLNLNEDILLLLDYIHEQKSTLACPVSLAFI